MLATLPHLHWCFGYLFFSPSFYGSWRHTWMWFKLPSAQPIQYPIYHHFNHLIYHHSISTPSPVFILGHELELLLFGNLKLCSTSHSLTPDPYPPALSGLYLLCYCFWTSLKPPVTWAPSFSPSPLAPFCKQSDCMPSTLLEPGCWVLWRKGHNGTSWLSHSLSPTSADPQ